jgi:hypothetical protein
MSTGTIYYVKQDNTIWGCGEADCCGEYYEEIDETFFECEHDIPESEMTDEHLQSCNGGGEVVEWRKADRFELLAFNAGKSDGFQEGSDWGIEWQNERIIKLLEAERDKFRIVIDDSWFVYEQAIALIKGENQKRTVNGTELPQGENK